MARAPQSESNRLKIFISYSRVDEAFADELKLGLEDKGYAVEIDKHSIRQGEEWKARLAKLIAASDTVVFVLSPDSAHSEICHWEVDEAFRLAKRVLPVLHRGLHEAPRGRRPDGSPWLEGPAKAPPRLTFIKYPRFDEGRSFMAGLKGLVQALEDDLDWIERHSRLAARARDWNDGGRSSNRLMSGADIAAAKKIVEERKLSAPPMLDVQLDFMRASEAHEAAATSARERELAERERLAMEAIGSARRAEAEAARAKAEAERAAVADAAKARADAKALQSARRVTRVTVAGLVVAVALTGVAGWFGYDATRKAGELEATTREAQITQSGLLSEAARSISNSPGGGDAAFAMLLALEGMPDAASDDPRQRSRPRVAEIQLQLDRAVRDTRESHFTASDHRISAVAWSPNGRYLASIALPASLRGGELLITDVLTGRHTLSLTDDGIFATMAWSRDGEWLAVGTWIADQSGRASGKIRTIAPADGHERPPITDLGGVHAVAWSPEGSTVAVGTNAGTQFFESATARKLRVINHRPATHVAFSPDGRFVAVAAVYLPTYEVLIFESSEISQQPGGRRSQITHQDKITGIAWSPDGKYLASISEDRFLNVLEVGTSRVLYQHKHTAKVDKISWSPDGALIATDASGTIRIMNGHTGQKISEWQSDAVSALSWTVEPGNIAVGRTDSSVRLHDIETGQLVSTIGPAGNISRMAWSPDGRFLASGDGNGAVRVLGLPQITPERLTRRKGVHRVLLSPDDKYLAAATSDGIIIIIELATRKVIFEQALARGLVNGFARRHDSNALAIWDGKYIRIIDRASRQATPPHELVGVVKLAEWSRDGLILVASSDFDGLQVFEPGSRRTIWSRSLPSAVSAIAWMPDGKSFVVALVDGKLMLLDPGAADAIWSDAIGSHARVLAWNPSGQLLAVGSSWGSLQIREAQGRVVQEHTFGEGAIAALDWSSNSEFLASGSWNRDSNQHFARIVRISTASSAPPIKHDRGIAIVKWSADNRLLLSSAYGSVQLFETATSKMVAGNARVVPNMVSAAWSGDNTSVVIAAGDEGVLSWRVFPTPQSLVDTAKSRAARCLTQMQRAQYFLPPAPPTWCAERQLWPYHTDEWKAWLPKQKAWLASGRQGGAPELPNTK